MKFCCAIGFGFDAFFGGFRHSPFVIVGRVWILSLRPEAKIVLEDYTEQVCGHPRIANKRNNNLLQRKGI